MRSSQGLEDRSWPKHRGQPEEFYKGVGESRTFTWHGAIFQGHRQSHRTETHLGEVFTERGKVFTEHGKEGSLPITASRAEAREINTGPYSPTRADLMEMPVPSTLLIEYRQLVASVTRHLGIILVTQRKERGHDGAERNSIAFIFMCEQKNNILIKRLNYLMVLINK